MTGGESRITALETTPAFQPPEVDTRNYQAWPADIWAMGLVFFLMLTGRHPFLGKSIPDVYDKIRTVKPELPAYIDADAQDMCMRMLDKDPETRIGFKDLRQHLFITNNGTEPWINLKEDIMRQIDEAETSRQENLAMAQFDEILPFTPDVPDGPSSTEKDTANPPDTELSTVQMESNFFESFDWAKGTLQTLHHASVKLVYLDTLPILFLFSALTHILVIFFPITRWLCSALLFISVCLFFPIQSQAKLKCPILIKAVLIQYAICLSYFDSSYSMVVYAVVWTVAILQNTVKRIIAPQVVLFAMHFWLFVSIGIDLLIFLLDNKIGDNLNILFPFAYLNVFLVITEKLWTLHYKQEMLSVFE